MNILTHCENVKAAIAADAALFAWCQTTYSTNPHVYGIMDERMPTTGKDYTPAIMVEKVSEFEGHALMEKRYVLIVGFIVRQPATDDAAVDRTDLQGEDELENFRHLIKDAITGMVVSDAFLERIDSSWESIEELPFFKGHMECHWSEKYCQGDDVFS